MNNRCISDKNKISIIIPVYNEEKNIFIIYQNISQVLRKKLSMWNYEILFINDGSKDSSASIIEKIVHNDHHVKGIFFNRNFGYQSALSAGYDYATGNVVITMDADMQHPPSLIASFIEKWQQGYDIVYARRTNRNDSFLKRFTAACYYVILQFIAHVDIPRNVNDFRLLDYQVVNVLKKMPEKARYLRGMVAWVGFNHTYIDFEQPARMLGTTQYTWLKLFKIACDGIISFCEFPCLTPGYLYSVLVIFFIAIAYIKSKTLKLLVLYHILSPLFFYYFFLPFFYNLFL